jgi:hypothetical protein
VRKRCRIKISGLNVDVWIEDVPRESVGRGVCVSGCCCGGVIIPGSLVLPGWSEFGFQ